MTPKSAKAKGRNLQNWTKKTISEQLGVPPSDITTAIMGERGADVKVAPHLKDTIPYHIECKARQKFNIYAMYNKAKESGKPVVLVIKQDREAPLVVVDAVHFFELLDGYMQSLGY